MILVDQQGNAVDAVIFDTDIKLYENTIKHDRAYLIANAVINDASPIYKSVFANNPFSWIINKRTHILLVERPLNVQSPLRKGIAEKLTDYDGYKNQIDNIISTIAVVVEELPSRKSPNGRELKEYVAIDKKFTTHKELVIVKVNESDVIQTLRTGVQKISTQSTKDVLEKDFMERFYLTAEAELNDIEQDFLYNGCEKCFRTSYVAHNEIFFCGHCGKDKVAKRRFKFLLRATDDSGYLDVTIFGEYGVEIFGMPEDEFYEKYTENSKIPQEDMNLKMRNKKHRFLIQPRQYKNIIYYNVQEKVLLGGDINKEDINSGKMRNAKRRLNFADDDQSYITTKDKLSEDLSYEKSISSQKKLVQVKIKEVEEAKRKAAEEKRISQINQMGDSECVEEVDIESGESESDDVLESKKTLRITSKKRRTRASRKD